MGWRCRACSRVGRAILLMGLFVAPVGAQGLGGAGTIQGTVKDPTGGVMQAVQVRISNPVSGFSRTTTTDAAGKYTFSNLSPNPYHITVEAQGFQTLERDVDVRTGVQSRSISRSRWPAQQRPSVSSAMPKISLSAIPARTPTSISH
jgi:hypothetical protein